MSKDERYSQTCAALSLVCKVPFLSKVWGKKPVLLGLFFHFAFWWAYLAWVRTENRGGWTDIQTIAQLPLAPIDGGIFYLHDFHLYPRSDLFWEWVAGPAGILVSIALIAMTILSFRKRRCWVVLLTHFVIFLYWLIGLALITAGD